MKKVNPTSPKSITCQHEADTVAESNTFNVLHPVDDWFPISSSTSSSKLLSPSLLPHGVMSSQVVDSVFCGPMSFMYGLPIQTMAHSMGLEIGLNPTKTTFDSSSATTSNPDDDFLSDAVDLDDLNWLGDGDDVDGPTFFTNELPLPQTTTNTRRYTGENMSSHGSWTTKEEETCSLDNESVDDMDQDDSKSDDTDGHHHHQEQEKSLLHMTTTIDKMSSSTLSSSSGVLQNEFKRFASPPPLSNEKPFELDADSEALLDALFY